jgi:type III restriction enzyme
MANESYEDFAIGLQREIEKEEGIKFGVIEKHEFSNITIKNENGEIVYLGAKESEKLYDYLHQKEYIDSKGKVQDSLRNQLRDGTLNSILKEAGLK